MSKRAEYKTVEYTEYPGVICSTRTTRWVKTANRHLGNKLLKKTEGFAVAAVTEVDKTALPLIIKYWDKNGRVAMTRFIGNSGAINSKGVTNRYTFDESGRLIRMTQTIHNLDGTDEVFRSYEYLYLKDRPDQEYTLKSIIFGEKEILTYEDRQKEH